MDNKRYVTVCKEVNGKIMTRNMPVQSWRMVAGKQGANGWKECIPTVKATGTFPELIVKASDDSSYGTLKAGKGILEIKIAEDSTIPDSPKEILDSEVQKDKHIITRQYLEGLSQPQLVSMAKIGMKKKEILIDKILSDQK